MTDQTAEISAKGSGREKARGAGAATATHATMGAS